MSLTPSDRQFLRRIAESSSPGRYTPMRELHRMASLILLLLAELEEAERARPPAPASEERA